MRHRDGEVEPSSDRIEAMRIEGETGPSSGQKRNNQTERSRFQTASNESHFVRYSCLRPAGPSLLDARGNNYEN